MVGDIFFTDDDVWLSNTLGFLDIINRAISKCGPNEDSLAQILLDSVGIGYLGINLELDRSLKIALTERVLEAAGDALQELHAMDNFNKGEEKHFENLAALAQAYLKELRGCGPLPNDEPNQTEAE